MSTLASVQTYDTFANRPAASIAGRIHSDSDDGRLFRDNGSSWDQIAIAAKVLTKTADYTATAADNAALIVMNSASAHTITLPAASPGSWWKIDVQNVGAGTLTVSRNSLLIDTAGSDLTLTTGKGCTIFSDGTNYFTMRGLASGGGGGGSNHFSQNLNVGVPSLASLTQINISGTGSAVENAGVSLTIVDTTPTNDASVSLRCLCQAVPGSTPYRVAFYCLLDVLRINYLGVSWGFRDSSSGKLATVSAVNVPSVTDFEYHTWNSATSRASATALTGSPALVGQEGIWVALKDDGSGNVIWETSTTGAYWSPIKTMAKSGSFLTNFSQVAFCLFCDDNTFSPTHQIAISGLCWDVTAISGRVVGFVG